VLQTLAISIWSTNHHFIIAWQAYNSKLVYFGAKIEKHHSRTRLM